MNVTLAVTTVAVVMMIVEALRPGRGWPRVLGWWIRAVALNAVQVGSVFLAGATYDRWMAGRRLWPAPELGPVAGAAVRRVFEGRASGAGAAGQEVPESPVDGPDVVSRRQASARPRRRLDRGRGR